MLNSFGVVQDANRDCRWERQLLVMLWGSCLGALDYILGPSTILVPSQAFWWLSVCWTSLQGSRHTLRSCDHPYTVAPKAEWGYSNWEPSSRPHRALKAHVFPIKAPGTGQELVTQCRGEGMSVNHSECLRMGRERMGQSPGHPAGAPGGRRVRRKLAGGNTETSSLRLTQALSLQLPSCSSALGELS